MSAATLSTCFCPGAGAQPHALAIVFDGETVTYGRLERAVRRLAPALSSGLRPASSLCGGWYTPLILASPIEKLRHVASLVQPDIIVGEPALVPA